jgi:hypothetical protein
MKLTLAILLFAASALAQQQPEGTYNEPTSGTDFSTSGDKPTCDPKYEYVGVVMNENVVAEHRCLPQMTTVPLKEWDDLRAQIAELQARVQELEAATKARTTAAPPGNNKVQTRERK